MHDQGGQPLQAGTITTQVPDLGSSIVGWDLTTDTIEVFFTLWRTTDGIGHSLRKVYPNATGTGAVTTLAGFRTAASQLADSVPSDIGPVFPRGLATWGALVYFSDTSTTFSPGIYSVSKLGGGSIPQLSANVNLAFYLSASSGGTICWANQGDSTIAWTGATTDSIALADAPLSLLIPSAGLGSGYIFWNAQGGKINKFLPGAASYTNLAQQAPELPSGRIIAVDDNRVYSIGSDGGIWMVPINGGTVSQLVAPENAGTPIALALSPDKTTLYWTARFGAAAGTSAIKGIKLP